MIELKGKSASKGICFGKSYIYTPQELTFEKKKINDHEKEEKRLKEAFISARNELELIKNSFSADVGEDLGHIFRAQMTITEDEDFINEVLDKIIKDSMCAESALESVFYEYSEMFTSLGVDDYNRQRLLDLQDVYKRLLRNLLGVEEQSLSRIPENSIIIAEDLMPSDTALMNKDNVSGIITEKGGITSHVAILAKSLEIPAAVGVSSLLIHSKNNKEVFLDTRNFDEALFYIDVNDMKKKELLAELQKYQKKYKEIHSLGHLEPITSDGKKITISANIGSLDDLKNSEKYGIKSIGLLRTEFFFLETKELPSEEQQYEFYKSVAEKVNPGMVIIRTLDIGGDKQIGCMDLPKEDNPFLGVRGIRLCMKHLDIFKTQLRAILRAAIFGNIKIMLPMVSNVTELLFVKNLLLELSEELKNKSIPHKENIDLGIMVETPSAALISDILTEKGDFVSIGTNDLTQYLHCADRINSEVSEYYKVFSPAVFRTIDLTSRNVIANRKWAGVCGELAGIPIAIPVLIGLGIEELSMSAQLIPEAISIIRNLNYEDCKKVASEILRMKTEKEIKDFLFDKYKDII